MKKHSSLFVLAVLTSTLGGHATRAATVEISSVRELADYAARSGNTVRMKPGVYHMTDYLGPDQIAHIRQQIPKTKGRPPVWMIRFSGNDNHFDFTNVTLEIDTTLYAKLPSGYNRSLFVSGDHDTLDGLTIANTGPTNLGSNGNTLSVWGHDNTIQNITVHVAGSSPYGYGDLLGKGGPNLVGLKKQSGIMLAGTNTTARRCKVLSRAFGHCFYIQKPEGVDATDNVLLEDCYAEGSMRPTADMLRETTGPLADYGYRTIAENRDGRYLVVPGYMKALGEDGFRTYGGTGRITLLNCTAVNTRAGFEIAGPDDGNAKTLIDGGNAKTLIDGGNAKTLIDGGNALGCERAYLIGSNVIVRRSRGDARYGPLLYLRGGHDSDIDLELSNNAPSDFTVHCLATLAGENHTVHLTTFEPPGRLPALPILLGFGMPPNAEMASPIPPAPAKNIHLINEIPRMDVIRGADATDCTVESPGPVFSDAETRALPKRLPSTTRPSTEPANIANRTNP